MVRFYDATDEADRLRVEGLLATRGIEYSLRRMEPGAGAGEILVAEEDLPFAEEVLRSRHHRRGERKERQRVTP